MRASRIKEWRNCVGFVVIWVKIDSLPRRDNWEVFYGSFTSEGPKAESADDVCHRDKALSQFGDFHRNWNHARIAARQDDLAGHNVIPVSYTHLTLPTSDLV